MTVGQTTTTFTYDDAGQLTSDGTDSYYYDANGNLTDAGDDDFTWDYRNMMTSATIDSTTTDYEYAGDGVRVSKDTTAYLYDRESGLPMLVDDGTNAYLHQGGALASIDGGDDALYLLGDALGSVRGVTDEAGDLDGTADYAVFGEVRASSGVSTLFRFTGEQHDTETGFTYLRARYANPALGRFISADSVQPNAPGTQGYNLYAYAGNTPTSWVDPSGHNVADGVLAFAPLLAIELRIPAFISTVYTLCTETYSPWCTVLLAGTTLGIAACAMYEPCMTLAAFSADIMDGFGNLGPSDVNWDWDRLKDAWKWWPTVPSVGPLVHFGMSRADCLEKFLDCDAGKWNPLKWGPIGKCDVCFANCIVQGKWPDWLCDPNKPKTKDGPFVRATVGPTCS